MCGVADRIGAHRAGNGRCRTGMWRVPIKPLPTGHVVLESSPGRCVGSAGRFTSFASFGLEKAHTNIYAPISSSSINHRRNVILRKYCGNAGLFRQKHRGSPGGSTNQPGVETRYIHLAMRRHKSIAKERGKHTSTREMTKTGIWSERDTREASANRGREHSETFVDGSVQFIERWKALKPIPPLADRQLYYVKARD